MLARTSKLVIPGIVLGTLGAFALANMIRGFLFEVSPYDPLTLVSTAGLLLLVTLVAALGPGAPGRGRGPARDVQVTRAISTRASLKHAPPATSLTCEGVSAVDTKPFCDDLIHAPFGMWTTPRRDVIAHERFAAYFS